MYEGGIMKVIPIIALLLVAFVYAGNVHVCEYEYQADDEDTLWYFVDYEYQSDIEIYYVEYEYQSDLCVIFVEYEYQADWEESSKWQGRLH